ncbi:hypothetical protein ACHWQZ_G000191 [Mnemiopsis leidyi]
MRFNEQTTCYLCKGDLRYTDRYLDHCHYTGEPLGYIHGECNRTRATQKYLPVASCSITCLGSMDTSLLRNSLEVSSNMVGS